MNNQQNRNLNKLVKIALLSAIAVVLMYFDFVIPFIPFAWLKIDLSDVPALMGAFAFGPIAGVVIELLKNLLILVVKGSETMLVGQLANFIVGCALVVPAAWVYHTNKSKKTAILGMILGTICIEIVGILANIYILLPAFGMGNMPKDELIKYVTIGLLPLNGLKAILVSVITYILYKRVSVSIFQVDSNFNKVEKRKLKSI
ncbi:ECF transporter S component [Clostridium sp. Sa3CUN1]|uniref:Riboflavin transporter n=1 Tax=Clostridium gallinarum TaxID=2762246 RepID=A0ABR8Q5A6_9CLOT|nr:ECF transporter S component [Clostridium gallinarum]MBD7915618.1 ECF transporter S component [Clostridium gallinarum]